MVNAAQKKKTLAIGITLGWTRLSRLASVRKLNVFQDILVLTWKECQHDFTTLSWRLLSLPWSAQSWLLHGISGSDFTGNVAMRWKLSLKGYVTRGYWLDLILINLLRWVENISINPRTDGGGYPPHGVFFLASGKTAARRVAKFEKTIFSSFLHIISK